MTSPARVVNRGIAIGAALIVLIGLAVGIFGEHANAPASGGEWFTYSVPPTTIPNMTGARPANVDGSWFTTSGEAEQYDYPMARLSCAELQQYLTTDLCAVANTTRGSMMFVATEGYWDPKEPDSDGIVRIPLYFQVFTHTRVAGPPRATSVLDGELFVDYELNESKADAMSVSLTSIASDDILVVEYETIYGTTPVQHVQILAMNSTGAPTLVAAYQGDSMRVASAGPTLLVSAHRYGPPNGNQCCDNYSTVWTLAPNSTGDTWAAVEQSHADTDSVFKNSKPALTVDTYDFPQKLGNATGA